MVLFRNGTYCESWSDDLDMKFMNSDMNSKKMRKFFRNSNSKKKFAIFAGLKRIRRKNSGFRFRFASLFDSKKNSLSLRFRNRFLAKIYRPASRICFLGSDYCDNRPYKYPYERQSSFATIFSKLIFLYQNIMFLRQSRFCR